MPPALVEIAPPIVAVAPRSPVGGETHSGIACRGLHGFDGGAGLDSDAGGTGRDVLDVIHSRGEQNHSGPPGLLAGRYRSAGQACVAALCDHGGRMIGADTHDLSDLVGCRRPHDRNSFAFVDRPVAHLGVGQVVGVDEPGRAHESLKL